LNPQYYIGDWNTKITAFFSKEVGVDLLEKDDLGRHQVVLTEPNSRYFLVENSASQEDCNQFIPFFKTNNIPLRYGIFQYNNIVTWIHNSNGIKPHSSNPEKEGFIIINFLNEHIKKNRSIPDMSILSLAVNEYMNSFHSEKKKTHKILNTKLRFIKIINAFFCHILYKIISKILHKKRMYWTKKSNECFTVGSLTKR